MKQPKTLLVLARSHGQYKNELKHFQKCVTERVVHVKSESDVVGHDPCTTRYVTLEFFGELEANHLALKKIKLYQIKPVEWEGPPATWPDQIAGLKTDPIGDATLRNLLTRVRDVHPDDLAPSLRDLRSAWVKAGWPGLERPVQVGSKPDIQLLVSGGKLSDEQVERIKKALLDPTTRAHHKIEKYVPSEGVTITPIMPDPEKIRRMIRESIDALETSCVAVPDSLHGVNTILTACLEADLKKGKPS